MNDAPAARPRLLAATHPHFAAGPLAYGLVLALVCKVARAAELALRLDSTRPWLLLPAVLAQDVMLAVSLGLLGHALGQLRRPKLRLALALLLLVPVGLLLPADVLAHLLTGRPITFQRLRGDEGATLGDLNLIETWDLIGGLGAVAIAFALLYPALVHAPRLPWLQRASRPRALLIALVLAFGANLLQSALLPHTQGLAEQPVFVLVQSFVDQSELKGLSLSQKQWNALLEPAQSVATPAAPAVRQKPVRNVVVFLAEGIPYKDTGFAPGFANKLERDKKDRPLPNPTPNLTRRFSQHGMVFDRYYASWHASIQAIYSIVCSAFPPLGGDIVRIKPRIDCGQLSEVLSSAGVKPGLFHGGQFNFYNKLALLGRRGNVIELDAEEIGRSSSRAKHQWGIDDRAVVEATLGWVGSLKKNDRFAALIIPITAHYPYWVPRDFKKPFKGSSRRERFLNGVAFQDQVFEQLLQGFEQRGLYDDTLFVWLGDHGHYVGEPGRITPGLREFYDANLHTPLVLLNPRMFPSTLSKRERRNARVGGHSDLMPTLLDALGVRDDDPRHQGQSLLSPDYRARRAFFGAEDGKFLGFIEGDHKFVIETRTRRTEYYDLKNDPKELKDLSAEFPERMLRYGEDAIMFGRGAQARIDAAPVLQEDVSVNNLYELFMANVRVTSHEGEQQVACDKGVCPGQGAVLRLKTQTMQGEKRRCVMVKVPTAGSIELGIAHEDALELLTGTIFALPGRPAGDVRFKIGTVVDGNEQKPVWLTPSTAVRPRHPRATRELRFEFEANTPMSKPLEVCLQLTTLGSQ